MFKLLQQTWHNKTQVTEHEQRHRSCFMHTSGIVDGTFVLIFLILCWSCIFPISAHWKLMRCFWHLFQFSDLQNKPHPYFCVEINVAMEKPKPCETKINRLSNKMLKSCQEFYMCTINLPNTHNIQMNSIKIRNLKRLCINDIWFVMQTMKIFTMSEFSSIQSLLVCFFCCMKIKSH